MRSASNSLSPLDLKVVSLKRGLVTVRDLLVVSVLTLISVLMHGAGWLAGFETASLDAFIRLYASEQVDDIVIVEIDELDYLERFSSQSPLDTRVLRPGIEAILEGNPAIVVVDLIIDESFELSNDLTAPVIWARDAEYVDGGVAVPVGGSDDGRVSGLAITAQDGDGVVRRYRRQYPTEDGVADSLAWAAFRVYCRQTSHKNCEGSEDVQPDESFLLNFAGNRYTMRRTRLSLAEAGSQGSNWADQGPMTGRIVVLGGTYRAARDKYVTSVGSMHGVNIVAQTIANELSEDGALRDVNKFLLVLFELLAGIAIVVFYKSFDLNRAFWVSLVGIPAIAIGLSSLAFHAFSLWATFAPVLLGTLIHQLYESKHALSAEHTVS